MPAPDEGAGSHPAERVIARFRSNTTSMSVVTQINGRSLQQMLDIWRVRDSRPERVCINGAPSKVDLLARIARTVERRVHRVPCSLKVIDQMLDASRRDGIKCRCGEPAVVRDLLVQFRALFAHGSPLGFRREHKALSVIDISRRRTIDDDANSTPYVGFPTQLFCCWRHLIGFQQPCVMALDRAVALTGTVLRPFGIEDPDFSAGTFDKRCGLQGVRDRGEDCIPWQAVSRGPLFNSWWPTSKTFG